METKPITSLADCETLYDWRYWMLRRSQRDIALAANVHQSTVSAVEGGYMTPAPAKWEEWARAYGLDLDNFKRLLVGCKGAKR